MADFLRIQKAETGKSCGEILEAALIHYFKDLMSIDQTNFLPPEDSKIIVDKLAQVLGIIEENTGIRPEDGKG